MKFLLSQSDIFSHFGAVKEQSLSSSGKATASGPKRRAATAVAEDLDEDEKAIIDEVSALFVLQAHVSYKNLNSYMLIGRR